MIEQIRGLILEHDKIWFDDHTKFRRLMYHHSLLVNRLNNAVASQENLPDAIKADIQARQKRGQ